MILKPRFETFKGTVLIGLHRKMSMAQNQTFELWKEFGPLRKALAPEANLYAVEVYPDTEFFQKFSPLREFEKWAAIPKSVVDEVPDALSEIEIPAGEYAVFSYQGKPSEAQATFQYIYGEWLPKSDYEMDARPYFALMDENYKGEHPDSKEEFWIPIKKKKK